MDSYIIDYDIDVIFLYCTTPVYSVLSAVISKSVIIGYIKDSVPQDSFESWNLFHYWVNLIRKTRIRFKKWRFVEKALNCHSPLKWQALVLLRDSAAGVWGGRSTPGSLGTPLKDRPERHQTRPTPAPAPEQTAWQHRNQNVFKTQLRHNRDVYVYVCVFTSRAIGITTWWKAARYSESPILALFQGMFTL